MATDSLTLIRTKLHRPRLGGDLVPRPQLLAHLECHRQRPLTLISAPAGYGKTSLISSWLENSEWPSAWLSLDEYDDDLAVFLNYVIVAIHTLFPESLRETLALLNAPELPTLRVLAASLINELDQLETSLLAYHRVLKLSRTIADLAGEEAIQAQHLAEALQYRPRSIT